MSVHVGLHVGSLAQGLGVPCVPRCPGQVQSGVSSYKISPKQMRTGLHVFGPMHAVRKRSNTQMNIVNGLPGFLKLFCLVGLVVVIIYSDMHAQRACRFVVQTYLTKAVVVIQFIHHCVDLHQLPVGMEEHLWLSLWTKACTPAATWTMPKVGQWVQPRFATWPSPWVHLRPMEGMYAALKRSLRAGHCRALYNCLP